MQRPPEGQEVPAKGRRDSNPRPRDPQPLALPTELRPDALDPAVRQSGSDLRPKNSLAQYKQSRFQRSLRTRSLRHYGWTRFRAQRVLRLVRLLLHSVSHSRSRVRASILCGRAAAISGGVRAMEVERSNRPDGPSQRPESGRGHPVLRLRGLNQTRYSITRLSLCPP